MSEAAKGTIIGAVGGAALGAIVNKKSPGAGAAIGGVIGGATGYTLGRAQEKRQSTAKIKLYFHHKRERLLIFRQSFFMILNFFFHTFTHSCFNGNRENCRKFFRKIN
jgi:hypothetical protein